MFLADRWWTVLSAGWLHAGLLHIFFNMFAARQLAPAVADLYGPGRMVIIYVAAGVVGFTLSSVAGAFLPPLFILRGAQVTAGASASISGLIGAILAYGHRSGSGMARCAMARMERSRVHSAARKPDVPTSIPMTTSLIDPPAGDQAPAVTSSFSSWARRGAPVE